MRLRTHIVPQNREHDANSILSRHYVATASVAVQEAFDRCCDACRVAMTPEEFKEAYDQASPEIQQMVSDKIRALVAKSEISHPRVILSVSGLGQPVLNLAEHDQ